MLSIYKVNIEKKYGGLLLKGLKKCDPMLSHTFPSQSKIFFYRFTKILILEKRLKAHFNFLSKVHSVFHHYLFPQDNLSHPTFPLAKSIVSMNQNFILYNIL